MKKTREQRKAELTAMASTRSRDSEFFDAWRLASDTPDVHQDLPHIMVTEIIEQILQSEFENIPAAK